MRSPVVSARISQESYQKLQELLRANSKLSVKALLENAIRNAHKKMVYTPEIKGA